MQRTIENLSDDELSDLTFKAWQYEHSLRTGTPREYLSLSRMGLTHVTTRNVAGYRLAEVCREAADKVEAWAREFEEWEDAYIRLHGHDGRGQP